MRPPKDKEVVTCPISKDKIKPSMVWDSTYPNGQKVSYGFIPDCHVHRSLNSFFGIYVENPCEWAGLPAPDPVELK